MQEIPLIRAAHLDELYRQSGWNSQGEADPDRRLSEFIFRNLRGSTYASHGYGSVEDVLHGDIRLIRRLSSTPSSEWPSPCC